MKKSGDSSNRRPHRRQRKLPDSVVFPPNPKETGPQVVDRIYRSFGLTDKFPKACNEFVQQICAKDPTDDPELKDCTDKPFITIDNDNSMDLDQAMHISRANPPQLHMAKAGYLVSYALADGAFFVPATSPLFQHALSKQGSSFYLPGKSIPMLPRELSEDEMSLNEGVKRRALIFDMYLDFDGKVIRSFYYWGCIVSRWKGTYREVSEYYEAIDTGKTHALCNKDYTETLDLLREVGILRRKLASDRNVVEYHREGSYITLDDKKNLVFAKGTRYVSELYNEQISLLCNSEGAKMLHFMDSLEDEVGAKDVMHPIYRSQGGPREEQVDILEAIINNTLAAHGLNVDLWRWRRGSQPIGFYLNSLKDERDSFPTGSKQYDQWSAVLTVIERQAMITNVAATFSPNPGEGHHCLKLTHYARFSSPMRELVGCFTHKELWEGHKGDFSSSKITAESDIQLRDKVIRAARRAKATQKRLSGALHLHMLNVTFYKDLQKYFPTRPVYSGTLMGMDFSEQRNKSRRCYVKLDEPAIEIKVFGEDLDFHYGCRYGADGETFGKFGSTVSIAPMPGSFNEDADDDVPPTFRAGQQVTIRVSDYAKFYGQTSRSRWIFIMDTDEQADDTRATLRKSGLRNSIVERDLLQYLEGEISTETEFSTETETEGER